MGRFVERVERQPTSGVAEGGFIFLLAAVALHQLSQACRHRLAQAFCLEKLPIIEGGAVAQAEAFQKVATHQIHRLLQRLQTGGTDFVTAMPVGAALCQQSLKFQHIDPYPSLRAQF